MTWWQIVIIVASAALGSLAGYFLIRILNMKRIRKNTDVLTDKLQHNNQQFAQSPLFKLIQERESAYQTKKAQLESLEKTTRTTENAFIVTGVPETPQWETDRLHNERFRSNLRETSENKVVEPRVEKTPAKNASPIFIEMDLNLRIATMQQVDKPDSFQTKVWDNKPDEISELPTKIQSELGKIYIDMRLANNIVWLMTEFGDSNSELTENYRKLCTSIATRLTKIRG